MSHTIESTPTKLGWSTSNIDGFKSSLDAPSVDASATDDSDQNTVPVSWNDWVAAVFNQGVRPASPSALDDLIFPRPPELAQNTNNYDSSWEPTWHTALVRRIMADPRWIAAGVAFHAATEEADLYSPLRTILNLISDETRKTTAGRLAGATTHLTWLSIPDTALILPPLSKSPRSKPDLVGVFGTSCVEAGKLELWAAHPNTWSSRIAAIDVLVSVEVGFTKVKRPNSSPSSPAPSLYCFTPSSHVALPPGYVTSEGNVRDLHIPPPCPKGLHSPPRVQSLEFSDLNSDVESEADDVMFHSDDLEDDIDEEDNPPPPPRFTADRLPLLFERKNGVYRLKGKAIRLLRYLCGNRETQVFRTGAVGFIVQNTEATFMYNDNSGTLITNPIDMFKDSNFITTIIHLVLADFPQFGFDPIWVPSTRVNPVDHAARVKADPRNGIGRELVVGATAYLSDRLVLRRFAVHGRGTTIIIVRRKFGEDGKLYLLKCSHVVNTRDEEATMSVEAKERGVHILNVDSWSRTSMAIWDLGVLSTRQPLQLRDRRIICFDEVCWMLGTIPDNRDFLRCFLDAIKSAFIS